ncbi:MAG TPA: type I DNA topoisomerase [Candidatus Polarisedimenticolaceae bacterium]|nr:type I DNA topoisomerase [Candidatus Polarisedimenticolaceae bacterium]
MARSLVIVESPAKAKTINKFLGRGFVVKASMGHVRDLPKRTLGVDEKTFKPTYAPLPEKKKPLAELKKSAKDVDAIFLAADPDREGEAICWHLKEELAKDAKVPFHRVLFNEITKKAILEAFEHPREIDANKVDAQQARRILDRFVGYKISPLLWDKVRRGLSAGRVQSVALRIIVERERAIKAFVPKEYWSLTAQLWAGEAPQFGAKLYAKDGKKTDVVSQEEMTSALAELGWTVTGSKPVTADSSALVLDVAMARADAVPFKVVKLQSQEKKKNPPPPFITSKLQQDAARQLGFPVAKTMRLAQGLYEGREIGDSGTVGLITYMRTDSTRISDEAMTAVRAYIRESYGENALPAEPRRFKVGKAAQEAHEAIRPTSLDYAPDRVREFLGRDEFRLYQLVWNRFVASQMETAVFDTTRADIEAGHYTFRATGSVLKFPGWLAVYHEGKDEDARTEDSRPADAEADDDEERRLPQLREGQPLELRSLLPRQHFTQPPPRFSEATLVKELEENGIGRPSTYAAIIATIMDRNYAEKDKGRFFPTELGELVNDLMVASFGDIVEVGYTARMEEELDEIEEGRLNWVDALREFQKKFEADLARAKKEMRDVKREAIPTDQICDKCGKPMVLKWGRFGQFLACSGYPECKNTREIGSVAGDEPPSPGKRGLPAAAKTAKVSAAPPDPIETEAEPCQKCGRPMVLKRGRFGAFLACSGYPECKTTRKIVVGKEGKAEAKAEVLLDEPCPKCGSKLAIKQGRFGEFTSCSNYPKCRYIKMKETGVDCPECGKGRIVERKSKRGKVFYGCDRYPDCGFVLWNKPVAKTCPDCKAPYLVEKVTKKDGRRLVCEQEGCGYVEQLEETPVTA